MECHFCKPSKRSIISLAQILCIDCDKKRLCCNETEDCSNNLSNEKGYCTAQSSTIKSKQKEYADEIRTSKRQSILNEKRQGAFNDFLARCIKKGEDILKAEESQIKAKSEAMGEEIQTSGLDAGDLEELNRVRDELNTRNYIIKDAFILPSNNEAWLLNLQNREPVLTSRLRECKADLAELAFICSLCLGYKPKQKSYGDTSALLRSLVLNKSSGGYLVEGRPGFTGLTLRKIPVEPAQHRRHIVAWHSIRGYVNVAISKLTLNVVAEIMGDAIANLKDNAKKAQAAIADMKDDAEKEQKEKLIEKRLGELEAVEKSVTDLPVPGKDAEYQAKLDEIKQICKGLILMNSNRRNLWAGSGAANIKINSTSHSIQTLLHKDELELISALKKKKDDADAYLILHQFAEELTHDSKPDPKREIENFARETIIPSLEIDYLDAVYGRKNKISKMPGEQKKLMVDNACHIYNVVHLGSHLMLTQQKFTAVVGWFVCSRNIEEPS